MILCIDPGLRDLGAALFDGAELRRAGLVRSMERTARGPKAWRAMADAVEAWLGHDAQGVVELVCEVPQVYAGAKAVGDPADLLELAGVDGAICGVLQPVELVGLLPRAWKGNVDPDVLTARVEAALTLREHGRIAVCPRSLRHNVLDAVGIGLHRARRLHAPKIFRGA